MAQMAKLTPRSLERRFRQATGRSPIDYVQRLRVEEAKRRLERSDVPIDEISWNIGYENAAFFRRLFKRLTRLNPSEYRHRFRMPNFQ
jgi:transcriptional regulator GlxA family with amidase domain